MNTKTLLQTLKLSDVHGGVASVPSAQIAEYARECSEAGAPPALMYATDERASRSVYVVHAVFAAEDWFLTLAADIVADKPSYPSLTRSIMAAHWYERLIHDQF